MSMYAILIKDSSLNSTGANLEQIMEHIPRYTMSYDYMRGFLDGYLMGDNYIIYSLDDFQRAINKSKKMLDSRYVVFLETKDKQEVIQC